MLPSEPKAQGIFYVGFSLALITIIPNSILLAFGIRRALQTTLTRNQFVIVLSYLLNEIALICRIMLIIPLDTTDALRDLIIVTVYLDLLLACFLLGELFKQISELHPSWTPEKILRLQLLVVSVIGIVSFGRVIPIPYTTKGDLLGDPMANWSIIGGTIGSVIFEIYYIWQNTLIYKSLYTFIKEKYSKLEEGAVFNKLSESTNYFAFMCTKSDFQIPLIISFWSRFIGIIVMGVDVIGVGLFYGKLSLYRTAAGASVGPVALSIQIIATLNLFERLVDINIKAKIENQPSNEAKEKAKHFIEEWRKKVKSPPPAEPSKETAITAADKRKNFERNRSNSALDSSILREDPSNLVKTTLPSSYTQEKIAALEMFKKSYPGVIQIESLKEQLKKNHTEAKKLGEDARLLKQQISMYNSCCWSSL